MKLVHPSSLAATVEAVNEAFFWGRPIGAAQRRRVAQWIAARHGLPGAYEGTFALLERERRKGIRLFTGERTISAAARHITAQESCRALRLLNVRDAMVKAALEAATARLYARIGPVGRRRPRPGRLDWLARYGGGTYCCGRCSVSFWRHITAGGFDDPEHRLAVALQCLKTCRDGAGQWRVFPFWYTLSALVEMDLAPARAEMRYAAPVCERTLKRAARDAKYGSRRREIARRLIGRV